MRGGVGGYMPEPSWNSSERGPATSADLDGDRYDVSTGGSGVKECFTDKDGNEHERDNPGPSSDSSSE